MGYLFIGNPMLCSYHTVTEPVIVWGLSTHPIRILGDYADLAVTPVPSRCSFEWLARERGTMDELTCVFFHETMQPEGYTNGTVKY